MLRNKAAVDSLEEAETYSVRAGASDQTARPLYSRPLRAALTMPSHWAAHWGFPVRSCWRCTGADSCTTSVK